MEKPNVIYIYADDLGRGLLSCYGQKEYKTPNIDRISSEGLEFTHAYGCAFCAPARASFLSGIHDAHQGEWVFTRGGIYKGISTGERSFEEIKELVNNTGIQKRAKDRFLAHVFKDADYVTGQIGKLEWGFATSPDELENHGWDYHYGYYDHRRCHGYYPPFLFENGNLVDIEGNTDIHCGRSSSPSEREREKKLRILPSYPTYSQDLFDEKISDFLRTNRNKSFFLYHPSQLPHGPNAIPKLHPEVADNPNLNLYEKEYASMVLRLDQTVGMILEEVETLGLSDKTMIVFASDNGHELGYYGLSGRCNRGSTLDGEKIDDINVKFYTDQCGDVFDGNDGMAGLKISNSEGGVRIPFLIKWPGIIGPGQISENMIANYDFMATMADIFDQHLDDNRDGISFLNTLREPEKPELQEQHIGIPLASNMGPALVTPEGWKLRCILKPSKMFDFGNFGPDGVFLEENVKYLLYNILEDYREERNLTQEYPEIVERLVSILLKECNGNLVNGTPQAHFTFYPSTSFNYSRT